MTEALSIAIFAKAPVPGYAKTRLIRALGAQGAAALAERLIRRIVAEAVVALPGGVTLWCAPDAGHPLFRELAASHGVRLAIQQGGDIGARMAHAFLVTRGPLMLVGADCPSLDAGRLLQVAQQLEQADLVIDPAEDGGYGLIAGRALPAGLFAGVAWSSGLVMEQTKQRAEQLGLRLTEGLMLRDLDTPEDLAWWQAGAPALFHDSPL
jgi:rSAM/selenodomain-associated transferase 1